MTQANMTDPNEVLVYTPEIAEAVAPLYEKVRNSIPEMEWPVFAPYIYEINRLKQETNTVILAHNYQTPEIFHCVADIIGDSLALAREAAKTQADTIVVCGVHFMAETAKLLNPSKTVLIPDLRAGCSLADAITAKDVQLLREKYPGVPVVTYVNTTAAVKAVSDVCCTSSNAVKIVESLNVPRVIFLPDEYLGRYVASQTEVEIILWQGHCEVHERFNAAEIKEYRKNHPDIKVIAHPECPPDVLGEADFVGSTTAMINYVDDNRPTKVVMVTECTMSDNVAVQFPDVDFIRPCNLCPHMRQITLPKIYQSLLRAQYPIEIPSDIAAEARKSVEKMLELS